MTKNELSEQVIDLINRETTIIVAATIDEDGSPRTAPFGWVYAVNSKTLRFSSSRGHDTYKNIIRDGRVMVSLMEEGNTAISIKGNARVYKDQSESVPHVAIIEIDISHIKSDVTRVGNVISGINCEINERYLEMTKYVYREMKRARYSYNDTRTPIILSYDSSSFNLLSYNDGRLLVRPKSFSKGTQLIERGINKA